MRPSLDDTYIAMAKELAKRSSCEKKKVGCLIIKNNSIIAEGYNGTPSGWDNCCEDEHGNTYPHVSHAEANAIAKLARGTVSSVGATMYCTLSPCYDCSKQLADCGIKRIVYDEPYRKFEKAYNYLISRGIKVDRYENLT